VQHTGKTTKKEHDKQAKQQFFCFGLFVMRFIMFWTRQ